MVYDLDDVEIISEVMEGAPTSWATILNTQAYQTARELQSAINYHEKTLIELENFWSQPEKSKSKLSHTGYLPSNVNLVGSHTDLPPPPFPWDNTNVLKCATPESKGA